MKKHYISANSLLIDSFKLAKKIHQQQFVPTFIIGIWRGGAPVGIAVQEYFEYVGITTDHIAIRTASYTGIGEQNTHVQVYGLNYVLDKIDSNMKVLIIDDVFDSGRSINAVLKMIQEKAGDKTPETIKVACPWFKPKRNTTNITPDFYVHETDDWLIFPHELKGLTHEEIKLYKGTDIFDILKQS